MEDFGGKAQSLTVELTGPRNYPSNSVQMKKMTRGVLTMMALIIRVQRVSQLPPRSRSYMLPVLVLPASWGYTS